jgi:hypothetical protein
MYIRLNIGLLDLSSPGTCDTLRREKRGEKILSLVVVLWSETSFMAALQSPTTVVLITSGNKPGRLPVEVNTRMTIPFRYFPFNVGGVLLTEEGYFYLHGNPKKKTHFLNLEERELYPFLPIELPVLKFQVRRKRVTFVSVKRPIGRPPQAWSEMSEDFRRRCFYAGDPRVPIGWTPYAAHLDGMKTLMKVLRERPGCHPEMPKLEGNDPSVKLARVSLVSPRKTTQ